MTAHDGGGPHALLATDAAHPHGEPGHALLDAALAARGVNARWAVWDDPAVAWEEAGVVAVRATWDYTDRAAEFLAWAAGLAHPGLLNGADVFRWNHDKGYLTGLGDLPVVPTRLAEDLPGLRARVGELAPAVVKPRVAAGGQGLLVVDGPDDPRLEGLVPPVPTTGAAGWVIQPLVTSVRATGETSVYVLDGEVTCQVDKHPTGQEVRVHEHHGGSSAEVPVHPDRAALARDAMAVAAERCGRGLDYGRVDLLHHDGRWVVSELELIEPGLYLGVTGSNAAPFADLVAARLATCGSGPC